MGLKGLKKEELFSKDEDIDLFINGASKRVQKLQKSNAKYKRVTFSLTDDVNKEIDNLVVNSKVASINRSLIIKLAVNQLGKLSKSELNALAKDIIE